MWTAGLWIAALLVLTLVVVRLLEARVAFLPIRGETETPGDYGADYEATTIETADGQRLHAWAMRASDARACILYFHGNGGNLSVWAPIVANVTRHQYAVLAFDYRGYGLSTGRPSERGLYRDVEAAVQRFWRDGSAGLPVVYWGRSLGVAMAAYAATVRKPDGLILESGFPDARSLVRDSPVLAALALFSRYRFPASQFLQRLGNAVPVLVLHGDNDHIVPIEQGRALFDGLAVPKRFVTIHGGDHNDVTPPDPDAYWGAVATFVADLERRNR